APTIFMTIPQHHSEPSRRRHLRISILRPTPITRSSASELLRQAPTPTVRQLHCSELLTQLKTITLQPIPTSPSIGHRSTLRSSVVRRIRLVWEIPSIL